MDYQILRKKYPEFVYQKYFWEFQKNNLVMGWELFANEFVFHPRTVIFNAKNSADKINPLVIDNFVFHLGMVEVFSYWKAFCSPVIKINAGFLDDNQLVFWKQLLLKGMGQYFFENNISFIDHNFVSLASFGKKDAGFLKSEKNNNNRQHKRILIAVGGGKDSSVTIALLAKNFSNSLLGVFTLNANSYPAIGKTVKVSGITNQIRAERFLDPKLLILNKRGFLNGHTPFSAYLFFLSAFSAVLFDYDRIVFSNEQSSNEGNAKYLGFDFNHQYSKTTEFENQFRKYNQRYLSDGEIFSFLRPLYDLQIMKIFSQKKNYFKKFVSCNVFSTQGKWCGCCPKCLSTFVSLYPFVGEKEMLEIFHENLFANSDLVKVTQSMIDDDIVKPFECVGTRKEIEVAFYLSLKKVSDPQKYPVLKYFASQVLPRYDDWEEKSGQILTNFNDDNNLPQEFSKILKENYFL